MKMNILLFGAAGFIGTNLTLKLAENKHDNITVVDEKKEYFSNSVIKQYQNVKIKEAVFDLETNFEAIIK